MSAVCGTARSTGRRLIALPGGSRPGREPLAPRRSRHDGRGGSGRCLETETPEDGRRDAAVDRRSGRRVRGPGRDPRDRPARRCPRRASAAPTAAPSAAPTAAPQPHQSAPPAPRRPPRRAAERVHADDYPETAVDCENPPTGYTGEISQIKALDEHTVEFDLCSTDVAFLRKVAFASLGDQRRATTSPSTSPDGSHPHPAQRHRPVHAQGVGQGRPHHLRRQPQLLGHRAAGADRDPPAGAPRPPSGSRSSRPAPSTASTTRRPRTSTPITRPTRSLKLYPREAPQRHVPRHEQHDQAVRQREGPPGDRDGHRPPADRRQLLPARLRPSPTTSRRARSRSTCGGDEVPDFDAAQAKQLLAEAAPGAGITGDFKTKISFRDVGPRLPARTRPASPRTSRPS